MDYLELLKKLISEHPNGFMKIITSRKYYDLYQWINESIPLLNDPFYSLKTKIYWLINGISEFPKCQLNSCNNILSAFNVINVIQGYRQKYCCKKCRYIAAQINTKQTCFEKYGVEYSFQSENNKEKSKQTCLQKYGVEYSSQNSDIYAKTMATNTAKYGYAYTFQNPATIEKSKQTCLEKYGETSFSKTDEFKLKVTATSIARYGVAHPSQTDHAKSELRKTCLEKYGVDSYSKTNQCKEQIKKTCQERYGLDNLLQSGSHFRLKSQQTRIERYGDKNYNNRPKAIQTCIERYGSKIAVQSPDIMQQALIKRINTNYQKLLDHKHVIPMFSETEYFEKTTNTVFKWKCLDCQHEFESVIDWNFYQNYDIKSVARCPYCYPLKNVSTSYEEKSFINIIKSIYNGKILSRQRILQMGDNKRHWLEIDCYLPELKIGFEYDGIYFHQLKSLNDNSNRHFIKTILAEQQGIRLIHVRSDEWLADIPKYLELYKNIINNNIDFSIYKDNEDPNIIRLDRSIFNKCVQVPKYELIDTIPPEKFSFLYGKRNYFYQNCGYLIYRKTI